MTWRRSAVARILTVVALAGPSFACRDDCEGISCPLAVAVTLTVTAQDTGGPVNDVTVDVAGAQVTTIPCTTGSVSTVCRVPGGSGTYELEVKAPGFESARRTVTVRGETGPCGCPIAFTQNLAVALVSGA